MNEYQEQLLEHYHNPKNFGEPSFTPTNSAKVTNLSCGDELEVWLKINTDGLIEDISFTGEGCSISIATASLLYDTLKGKNIDYIKTLNEDFAVDLIGIPLTISRIKCAALSVDALKKSL